MMHFKTIYIVLILLVQQSFYAQKKQHTTAVITIENQTLETVLKLLENTYDVSFAYNSNMAVLQQKITKEYTDKTLDQVLDQLLPGFFLDYKKTGNTIVVFKKRISSKRQQQKKLSISGYLYDKQTGEILIGAVVLDTQTKKAVITDTKGFFSLQLKSSSTIIEISHIGYETLLKSNVSITNTPLEWYLYPSPVALTEVVLTKKQSRSDNTTSATVLTAKQIKALPLFLGEPDVLKAIQLKNGVTTKSEFASFYYVRGGNFDQNLVLLDQAPIYNASHIMGLVSVINTDAIHRSDFYKGYFDPQYAGRTASVLDITTKDGNTNQLQITGNISSLGGKLLLDGPIIKDKLTYMVSLRRSWLDLLLKGNSYPSYYDINTKLHYKISAKDKIYLSGYLGNDLFKQKNKPERFTYQNNAITLRWNHSFNNQLTSNTSLIYNRFKTESLSASTSLFSTNLQEFRLHHGFTYYLNHQHKIKAGIQLSNHLFTPGIYKQNLHLGTKTQRAYALYASHKADISDKLQLQYGIHTKLVQAIGGKDLLSLYPDYTLKEFFNSSKRNYKNWLVAEPRALLRYNYSDTSSFTASYVRMHQFVHSLYNYQNDYDLFKTWIPVSNNIKPLASDLYSLGYHLSKSKIAFDAELYYRKTRNQLDYTPYPDLESKVYERFLRHGTANSYGIELGLAHSSKKLDTQILYTYSKTKIHTPGINNNQSYRTAYDIPHQIKITSEYRFTPRWSLSSVWTWSSGRVFTLPVATQLVNAGQSVIPVYGSKFNARTKPNHRLNLMLRFKHKPNAKYKGTWAVGVSNAYGQKSSEFIHYDFENKHLKSYASGLFEATPIIPILSYSFKY